MYQIGDKGITFNTVYDIVNFDTKVKLSKVAKKKLVAVRKLLEKSIQNKDIIYGVTTGFGAFKNKAIASDQVRKLQENILLSHSVGVGKPFEDKIVRTILFLIANYLAKGYSGVRPVIIETLIEMINKGVHPIVPEKGSVGSSGDLAPAAHLILVLIGKGEANFKGKKYKGADALRKAGIKPIILEAKEGLALVNNTATMTANAIFALMGAKKLLEIADIAGALSAEALRATTKAYEARIHRIRPQKGQMKVATHLRRLLAGSTMIDNSKIHDQYSLRCIPQIHGAVRDAVEYVEGVINIEVNSVTDNPLIFIENGRLEVVSGGNFHGEPVAITMDTLGLAISTLANISDRRTASILDPATNNGLPTFLAEQGGLNSGMMILQYTTAALTSENKILSHPASVDSIPTSANVEDVVSMGTISARKAREIVDNVKYVLAIEILVACQAIDFRVREKLTLGRRTGEIYNKVREKVPFFSKDELFYPYIQDLVSQIEKGNLL